MAAKQLMTSFLLLLFLFNIVSLATAQSCPYGDVRLTNGTVPYEGRLEFCYRGSYVTVCYEAWYSINASYICSSLGCAATQGTYYSVEAGANYPYYVSCYGSDIPDDCRFDRYICDRSYYSAVGVRCNPQIPGVPSNVTFTDTQSDSFIISWSPPSISQCQYIESYTVSCSSHGDDQHQYSTVESSSMSLNITGLLPFTSYTCCVAANNSAGEGDYLCSTVLTQSVPPDSPQAVFVTSVSSTSVLVGWTNPHNTFGPLTGYIINCSPTTQTITLPPDESSIRLAPLSPNTHYLCCVSATNMAGRGELDCVSFQTDTVPPSAPVHLSIVSSSSFSVRLSWVRPTMLHGLTVEYYTINCSDQSSSLLTNVTENGDNVSASIDGFVAMTTYTCCVSAVTEAGRGQETCITVSTQELQKTVTVSSVVIAGSTLSILLLLVILISVVIVIVVVCVKRRQLKTKGDDAKDQQQHVYEEMDVGQAELEEKGTKVQSSTNTLRYQITQLHSSDTTTSITPQLPSREYLKDESFMEELAHSDPSQATGGVELEPEDKVYQPLIPPRLNEIKEEGDYQALTHSQGSNDVGTTENTEYEPVTFKDEQ